MTAVLSAAAARPSSRRESHWRHVDFGLLVPVLGIASLGMLMVFSATKHALAIRGADPQFWLKRQAVFVALGVVVMLAVMAVDYRLFRDFAPVFYTSTAILLLLVISPLGSSKNGAQAWFDLGPFQLQPSELAKVTLIIALSSYCSLHRGDLDLDRVVRVLLLAGVPMALIYLQPDLGTALVFVAVLMGMLLVAGVRPRHMAALTLLGLTAVVLVFQLGVLEQYQVERLTGFLDPARDTERSTYNLRQSEIAIGSGGLTGKGLFDGSQTNLSFVPEQHTDFIFTVVGEELGFVGSAVLLTLFAIVVWRIWRAAALARDLSGTLLCVGVLAMLVFQIFENVGMTMGIMPITGIPLPFMSYGGSATLGSFAAIGLVLNVHMRRFS